ncbi:hypothetical protein Peur_067535 [Populus x canadensis]
MGSVVSQAANGIGGVLGNAFAIPIKTLFGVSCEDVCSGPWDLICFIEHLCLKNTKRVNRRRRFRDIKAGYTSSLETDFSEDYHHLGRKRKSAMERRKIRLRSWRSLHPSSMCGSRNNNHRQHHQHHVRLKTRESSVHVKGGSRRPRNSRRFQLARLKNPQRNMGMFKRKRLR